MFKDGFVFREINKYNQRLLIITLILVFFVAALGNRFAGYWYNLFNGPFEIDSNRLDKISSVDTLKEFYVRVKGDQFYQLLKDDGFYLLKINDALLVIKGQVDEDSLELSGELKDLSEEDQLHLYQAFGKKNIDFRKVKGSIYPVFLEVGNFQSSRTTDYILLSMLLVLVFRNIVAYLKRKTDPSLHPICKYLSQFGIITEMVNIVDSEVSRAQGSTGKSSIIITDTWIIIRKWFKLQFIALSDVVWVYQKITSHRYGFIPVGKTYELIVYTKDEEMHEFKSKNGMSGEETINMIGLNAPWVLVGYSEKFENMWKKNRPDFIQTVQDRFKQVREYGEESLRQ